MKSNLCQQEQKHLIAKIIQSEGKLNAVYDKQPLIFSQITRVFNISETRQNIEALLKLKERLINICLQEKQGFLEYLSLPKFRQVSQHALQLLKASLQQISDLIKKEQQNAKIDWILHSLNRYIPKVQTFEQVQNYHLSIFELYARSAICPISMELQQTDKRVSEFQKMPQFINKNHYQEEKKQYFINSDYSNFVKPIHQQPRYQEYLYWSQIQQENQRKDHFFGKFNNVAIDRKNLLPQSQERLPYMQPIEKISSISLSFSNSSQQIPRGVSQHSLYQTIEDQSPKTVRRQKKEQFPKMIEECSQQQLSQQQLSQQQLSQQQLSQQQLSQQQLSQQQLSQQQLSQQQLSQQQLSQQQLSQPMSQKKHKIFNVVDPYFKNCLCKGKIQKVGVQQFHCGTCMMKFHFDCLNVAKKKDQSRKCPICVVQQVKNPCFQIIKPPLISAWVVYNKHNYVPHITKLSQKLLKEMTSIILKPDHRLYLKLITTAKQSTTSSKTNIQNKNLDQKKRSKQQIPSSAHLQSDEIAQIEEESNKDSEKQPMIQQADGSYQDLDQNNEKMSKPETYKDILNSDTNKIRTKPSYSQTNTSIQLTDQYVDVFVKSSTLSLNFGGSSNSNNDARKSQKQQQEKAIYFGIRMSKDFHQAIVF